MASSSSPTAASPPQPASPAHAPGRSSSSGGGSLHAPSRASSTLAAQQQQLKSHSSIPSQHSLDNAALLRGSQSLSQTPVGSLRRNGTKDRQHNSTLSANLSSKASENSLRDWRLVEQGRARQSDGQASSNLQSPLLDCVKPPLSPALLSGNSLAESSSSISFARSARQEKDLPRLPSTISIAEQEEDSRGQVTPQGAEEGDDAPIQHGAPKQGHLSPRSVQAQTGASLSRLVRARTPKRSPGLNPNGDGQETRFGSLPFIGRQPSSARPDLGRSEASSSTLPDEAGEESNNSNDATSPNWLERTRVKSAGQSAGAGLRKWGKASAAKLKQAQQSSRENGNPIMGMWNRSTSNLRKYDGSRGAKSATDLTLQSVEFSDLPPPVPTLVLPTTHPDPNIGLPTDVRHNVHVDVGPKGYTGLPESWAQVLAQFGFNAEEVRRDPQIAADVVRKQTKYFIDREAERGRPPENTRKLLESKLYEFEDLRYAVYDAGNSTDEAYADYAQYEEGAQTKLGATKNEHNGQSASSATLPASPTSQLVSPTLPQVGSDDDDWGASLLQSLPIADLISADANDDSVSRDLLASDLQKPRPASKDYISDKSPGSRLQSVDRSPHPDSEAEDLREDGNMTLYEEETAIMVASKITAAKATKGLHLLPHANEADAGRKPALRRESEGSVAGSSQSHTGLGSLSHAPTAWSASRSAQSIADLRSRSVSDSLGPQAGKMSGTVDSNNSLVPSRMASVESMDQSHLSGPSIVVATPPARGRASSDSHMTGSDQEQQLSTGLRERRRAHPRVYPPSAHRMPRDSELTAALGFKRPGSSGRPSSSQDKQQESPLLRALPFTTAGQSSRRSSASGQGRKELSALARSSVESLRLAIRPLSPNPLVRRPSQSSFRGSAASHGASLEAVEHASTNASTVSHRQHVPEFIHPDSNGFYKAPTPPLSTHSPSPRFRTSIESSSQSSSMPAPGLGMQYLAENHSGNVFRSSANTFAANSPLGSHDDARDSYLSSSAGAAAMDSRSSRDGSAVAEDYQPASDFINDWIQADGGSSRRASTTTGSDDGAKESGGARARESIPEVPALPNLQTVSALSSGVAPGKHQSPSPALLLGLPALARSPAQATAAVKPATEGRSTTKSEQNPQDQSSDHEILQDHAHLASVLDYTGARDWRTRSLPPPPAGDDEEAEREVPATKRSSRTSLPDPEGFVDETGPPLPDASVVEAVSLSRLSSRHSRQSRTSSRAGKRSHRRSADARRFPVSMHYASGFDADGLSLDRETSASFSQLMRARQSFDLDDVLPSDLNREAIPPVPPMPHNAITAQRSTEDLPESTRHLIGIIRQEKPSEALGEMVMIGEGDSGDVYSSIPLATTRIASFQGRGKVAVKVVTIPESTGQGYSSRLKNLRNELDLWRSVQGHEHIVTFFDAFVSSGDAMLPGVWIVQEFMSMSLADVIGLVSSGLQLTEEHMRRVLYDVVQGMQHLHQRHVVHRDIRSDNILLTFDGIAKISDFTHAASLTLQQPTRNSVVGTAYWMAPEVVKAEEYTYKADIWSFGVVIFEMLEGSPPRVELPALRAITLTAKLGLPGLSAHHSSSASTHLQRCMAWCTELSPAERPTADVLGASEYFARAGSHSAMADLVEQARALECDITSVPDEDETTSVPEA